MPAFSDLIFILIPIVFVAFWCLVCSFISRGGWRKLAKRHTAYSPPEGRKFSWQSCTLNRLASYRQCITFHVGKSGLRISVMPIFAVGHPALFFDWSKIRFKKQSNRLFGIRYLYDLGTPRVGSLSVPSIIHQAIQGQTQYR